MSSRQDHNFVPVNCVAIPENILEIELFGHKKGTFTGADTDKNGLLDEADTGSLFLDEIGEINPGLQVKLLRTIEKRKEDIPLLAEHFFSAQHEDPSTAVMLSGHATMGTSCANIDVYRMIPRIASAYDQNPARIALVLKGRRKQSRKPHPRAVSLLILLGIVALYAAVYFPG